MLKPYLTDGSREAIIRTLVQLETMIINIIVKNRHMAGKFEEIAIVLVIVNNFALSNRHPDAVSFKRSLTNVK